MANGLIMMGVALTGAVVAQSQLPHVPSWMPYVWTGGQAVVIIGVGYIVRMEKRVAVIETEMQHLAKQDHVNEDLFKRVNRLEQQIAALRGMPVSDDR